MAVLKEEFAKMEREKNQTTIAHEKQHIRMMFMKFMESALQGYLSLFFFKCQTFLGLKKPLNY